ncbi:hypothetical protein GLE_3891 [Lysobacter enzymogenes]|uniref:Uncharacterized protein n=1 Tax=Lysobacter enzymogenes TaxID=69 RepID=A0A0S2DL32_LYSEN|nr:hypothetical protein GLE_3891 [Lysobacter enzymogenes]
MDSSKRIGIAAGRLERRGRVSSRFGVEKRGGSRMAPVSAVWRGRGLRRSYTGGGCGGRSL